MDIIEINVQYAKTKQNDKNRDGVNICITNIGYNF